MLVKKFLIVSPVTPKTFWDFSGVFPYLGIRSAHSSLTLITLAALLPRDSLVRLIDMNTDELTDTDIGWADVVMLTGMTVHRQAMAGTIERLKSFGKTVIVGGPFASAKPDAPELQAATSVFVGEAIDRPTFKRMLQDIDGGQLERCYRAERAPDIRMSPIPRFDLLDFRKFADVTMQVTCGCPFRCDFCEVWTLFGTPRVKSPEQVVAELQALYGTGYRGSVFIVDDNYVGNEKAIRVVTQAILEWQRAHDFPFFFYTQTDIRLAEKEDLARLMVDAGFYAVFIGVESPSAAALKGMKKAQNVNVDAPEAVAKLRKMGLMVHVGLILGTDADGLASFGEMEQFVGGLGVTRTMLGMCAATPGTVLYERLDKEGRIIADSIGDQFERPNFQPKNMSLRELVAGHGRVFRAIYEPANYFRRALREVREWKVVRSSSPKLREYRAAMLSIIFQGILAPYGREYWQFMLEVAKHDPRKIGRAFAIAITYAHFYGYAQGLLANLEKALEQIGEEDAAA